MTDILLPVGIDVARVKFRLIDSVGVSRNPLTGAVRTASRGGDKLGATIEYAPTGGMTTSAKQRQRILRAHIAQLIRSNRCYLYDPGYRPQGSFPATELFSNNDFSDGATGWDAGAPQVDVTAQDRVLRMTALQGAPYQQVYQSVTLTQYVPYALRTFITDGHAGLAGLLGGPALALGSAQASAYSAVRGYRVESGVNNSAIAQNEFPAVISSTSGFKAGDFWEVLWCSLARCALVDNGPNALLDSNEFEDTGNWGRSQLSGVTSGGTAPDGTATSRSIIENSSAGSHYIAQTVTGLSASALDYSFSVYMKAGTRSYGYIEMSENSGPTSVYSYLDLNDGSWDAESTGANWSNLRKHVTVCGNGWFRFTITARKTNAATSITVLAGIANAANGGTYTGDGASYVQVWGASLSQSGVPVRYVATTTAATTGTAQSGNTLYLKGLPASTSGLLLFGDWVQFQTSLGPQLCMVVSSLDSDAAGLGILTVSPAVRGTLADSSPTIINAPMGRFMPSNGGEWMNDPGIFTTATAMDFEEAPA